MNNSYYQILKRLFLHKEEEVDSLRNPDIEKILPLLGRIIAKPATKKIAGEVAGAYAGKKIAEHQQKKAQALEKNDEAIIYEIQGNKKKPKTTGKQNIGIGQGSYGRRSKETKDTKYGTY